MSIGAPVGAPKVPGLYAYVLYRLDNTFVLLDLEENEVQTLVDIAIKDLFPEPCNKWWTTNQNIRTRYIHELGKREDKVRQEITKGEDLLRYALHEAVVEDVMRLFPYDFMTLIVLWTLYC